MSTIDRLDDDGLVTLRLNAGKTNALTIDVVIDLDAALAAAGDAGAIVLCGGERFFCNGLDLAWALGLNRVDLRHFFLTLGGTVGRMLALPVPIVGCLKGHAIGAGKTLFIACDHRVAASGRVLIGSPEVTLGVPNPFFADALLRFIVGDATANELLYGGALVPAERMTASGLVQDVVAPADIDARAEAVARGLAARPRGAFTASKRMRSAELRALIERHLAAETEILLDNWFAPQAQALLRAAATPRRPVTGS